jgi:carbonic anhydrase
MFRSTDDEIRARISTMRGVDATGWDFLTGTDQQATLGDDLELIASCPLLPRDLQVGGFVFDVHTGDLVRVLDGAGPP